MKIMHYIVRNELLTRKELLPFIVTLFLYEHYLIRFDLPDHFLLLNEYLPLAMDFFNLISDEDLKNLYENLATVGNRELCDILLIKMKCVISKKKNAHLRHLNNLRNVYSKISSGISSSKFIL